MKYKPYKYQAYAEQFIIEHPAAGLFLDMGLGKTVITLSAVDRLMHDAFEVDRVLIIAPLLPARETWPAELLKWDHLGDLSCRLILGPERDRISAATDPADLYVVNRENVPWLVEYWGKKWPYDMVVIDELSSFKSSKAQRFRALRKVRKYIKRIVGLTGTPAPNGLQDLYAEMFLLDGGERLGRTLSAFHDKYFTPGRRGPNGIVYEYKPKPGAAEDIQAKISDIAVSMSTADYVDLPDQLFIRHDIKLPPEDMAKYRQLQRDLLLPLDGGDIDAGSAAILANKLLQLASGTVYDENGEARQIHAAKMEKLEQLLEEANGQPVLVFYNYQHELQRIREAHPEAVHVKDPDAVKRWNAGTVPLLLANPASAGHGLNLQAGGHIIVWFSPTWNLEYYQQANKRLHRRGQRETVLVHNLVAAGTIDERVYNVALKTKEETQAALMDAIRAAIEEEKSNAQYNGRSK